MSKNVRVVISEVLSEEDNPQLFPKTTISDTVA